MYTRICYTGGNPVTGKKMYETHKYCECIACRRRYNLHRGEPNKITAYTDKAELVRMVEDYLRTWECKEKDQVEIKFVHFNVALKEEDNLNNAKFNIGDTAIIELTIEDTDITLLKKCTIVGTSEDKLSKEGVDKLKRVLGETRELISVYCEHPDVKSYLILAIHPTDEEGDDEQ